MLDMTDNVNNCSPGSFGCKANGVFQITVR